MEFHEKLRIVTGSLCIVVAILRIVLFFFEFGAAAIYSFLFINPNETVNIFEAILIVIFAAILTILVTIFAVVAYIVLGILQIVIRDNKTPSILCNILSGIGILFSIRVFVLLASINESSILLTILAIFYTTIFSLSIISYIKFRKKA